TLGSRLSSHANALNAIRLLLAAAVILGHTVPVGGYPESAWQNASGTAVQRLGEIPGPDGVNLATAILPVTWSGAGPA
ncbi:hypothetical protein LAM22_22165, partial [Mycobacterium tuberculosis]|nr:hypothetical protein [Mycobacterium tuberculosis]